MAIAFVCNSIRALRCSVTRQIVVPTMPNRGGPRAVRPKGWLGQAGVVARVHPNRLITALPSADRKRLLEALQPVSLTVRQPLYEARAPIKFVYFPLSGVHSIVTSSTDGDIVEVAAIGNEGMVGIPVFLGGTSSPDEAFCQVPGDLLQMRAARFREELHRSLALRTIMLHYTQAFIYQIAQHAACSRLHSIVDRCAGRLLMTHDRVRVNDLVLTQEVLAQMLGVRRATVTIAAGMLQHAGLIRYARGRITIVDRKKLERASCDCYRAIRREFKRLLG
jgi:CRP-like cAMP-binding protein